MLNLCSSLHFASFKCPACFAWKDANNCWPWQARCLRSTWRVQLRNLGSLKKSHSDQSHTRASWVHFFGGWFLMSFLDVWFSLLNISLSRFTTQSAQDSAGFRCPVIDTWLSDIKWTDWHPIDRTTQDYQAWKRSLNTYHWPRSMVLARWGSVLIDENLSEHWITIHTEFWHHHSDLVWLQFIVIIINSSTSV